MPSRQACALIGLVVLVLVSTQASAQASPVPAPRVDTVAHRLAADGSRLRAMVLTYRSLLTRDSVASFVGEVQIKISETQYAGAPAWLLTQNGTRGTGAASDSLVVTRADLRPLHWIASLGPARLAAEFRADTVFGAMSSPLGRQNIVLGNRADLLVNSAAVDALLATVSLDGGWRDSARVLVVDAGGSTTAAATMAVDGEEHVSVPAGEFDCWIVSLETERGSERLWVSKQDPTVVRSEQILPQLGGAVLERALIRVEPIVSPAAPPPPSSSSPTGRTR